METILATKEVPKNATILIVDLQEQIFDEIMEGHEAEERAVVKQRYEEKLEKMKEKLLRLKENGHRIYATVDKEGIYEGFESVPDVFLPSWEESKDKRAGVLINPAIPEELKGEGPVLVCGLWLELCELEVTRGLTKAGIECYLSLDEDLSLKNSIMWTDDDVITVKDICEEENVQIDIGREELMNELMGLMEKYQLNQPSFIQAAIRKHLSDIIIDEEERELSNVNVDEETLEKLASELDDISWKF